ncbi:integration host factor subunit alpha [Candidatus Symbiobacter mobilis]|uniref:Integration host factor subunit alpha n=1 Tax=Candidatus Symbiobacter mobilis CR TaxID=946483 RepID=U5N7H9_9BURK|nr:integration host factor subunit alpha [Candidatus Symbiobacter mobilis]AGX86248.1 integration host factor subunit alpha [Candidatus Symbiobacter mobilis CR]
MSSTPVAPSDTALTKAEMADRLYERVGLSRSESKAMVDTFFHVILQSLAQGQEVKISGFGNFKLRTKTPRPGRNPRTGESVDILARRVVTFHASPKLKELIQQQP